MKYDIYINSSIGWPFSAEYVRSELDKCKNKPCNVYISSLGGSAIDAFQIRQMFIEHGDVTVHLHGFVASAATIIAMGAKQIVMGEFALFLMHQCSNWVETWGMLNKEEIDAAIQQMQASRNALETIDQTVASIYAARCGRKVQDVAAWMSEASWLTASECQERGLIDSICKDDAQPVITDELRGEFLACGFPLPASGLAKSAELPLRSLMEGAASFIKSLMAGTRTQQTTQPTNTTNTTTMEQQFKHILAALHTDGLTSQGDKYLLASSQLSALESRISALEEEKKKLEEQLSASATSFEASQHEIDELKQQVANLQKQDGADTHHVEDVTHDEPSAYASRARDSYNRLKQLA